MYKKAKHKEFETTTWKKMKMDKTKENHLIKSTNGRLGDLSEKLDN